MKIVSNIGLECKLLSVIIVDLFGIIILVFLSFKKVIKKLIFVFIVNFSFVGIVLMIFLWSLEIVK